jgi:DNA-binding PadR family transcriptional regulator
MGTSDPLGQVEFAVLDALHRGALCRRHASRRIKVLDGHPVSEAMVHQALQRCERDGLVRGRRDGFGRRYELTAAGRSRVRADRRFRAALLSLLVRSSGDPARR